VQQTEVQPHCVFRPGNTADVSAAIRIVRQTQCTFAVRSGGHAAFAGASNAPNGLTIDLRDLNGLKLSDDNEIAHIGAGNTWYEVYIALQPSNLTVIGGRVATIGVGGLTTGGP
jgi:FAD/FMN-containing dehydrogenase